MDLEILVRLVQLQMYSNNFESQRSQDSGLGNANFAVLLAALMNENGVGAGVGQTGRAVANYSAKTEELPMKTLATRHIKTKPAAMQTNTSSRYGLENIVESAANKFGIAPELLKAVAKVESGLNPMAVSSSGAMGLMQLMPGTAASLGVNNPFDSVENAEGGARYLKSLLDKYGGDAKMALAAYNAGPGAVDRYGGVPPYSETISYLNKINNIFRIF